MTHPLSRPVWPLAAFAAWTAAAYGVALAVVLPLLPASPAPGLLASALTADLVGLVPLAYAALVVGVWGAPRRTLVPVLAASVAATWWILPTAHRGALEWVALAVPALEAAAVGGGLVALTRALRGASTADAYERLREATARSLGDHLGSRALAFEMAIARYALGRAAAPDPEAFGTRGGYGTVLAGLSVALLLELVGGHVLVSHLWGPVAAGVHLALSGYAVLWLIGDYRALGARPVTLGADTLHLRTGLRWSVDVPIDAIASVHHVRGPLPTDAPLLDVSVMRSPQFILELTAPVTASGPYGVQREVRRLAVGVDEPERFLDALAGAMRA